MGYMTGHHSERLYPLIVADLIALLLDHLHSAVYFPKIAYLSVLSQDIHDHCGSYYGYHEHEECDNKKNRNKLI